MATSFRKKIGSAIVLAFLGLAVIAMVVTGFGTDGMGGLGGIQGGANTVVAIEDERITEAELSDAVSRQFRQAQQQQPELTMAQFLAGGTFDQILSQLVFGIAIADFARDQGLVVSEEMIDREIVRIPSFRNFAGQFDETVFRQQLAQQNMTEAQLRQDIARALLQQQLLGPVAAGSQMPTRLATAYAGLLLERRQGVIGVVPAELTAQGIDPSPQEVAAFYRENQARFVVPERRVIRYATIDPQTVAAGVAVSDAEIRQYYQQNRAQYAPQERRSLQQVVLPDQAAARAFVQRVQGGASFADAASQAGFAPADIDLGVQTPEGFADISNQQIARAAFAAEEGAVVGPLQSELGWHVVRVEDVATTGGRPLEAVRGEIEEQLRERKVEDALNSAIERVQDLIEEGASLGEAASAAGLQVRQTPPVTATGQMPGAEGPPPAEVAEIAPALRSAFELLPEDDPIVEQLGEDRRFALLGVERVIPPAAPPLEEIRDEVRAALVSQRALDRAREIAREIQRKIEAGTAPRQAFAEAGIRLPPPQDVNLRRMDISQGGERVPPPLALLFSLPEGGARILEAPNQAGWFVVHHAERIPGDASENAELVETVRGELSAGASEEIAQQFARAVQARAEIERNEEAIARIRRQLTGDLAE